MIASILIAAAVSVPAPTAVVTSDGASAVVYGNDFSLRVRAAESWHLQAATSGSAVLSMKPRTPEPPAHAVSVTIDVRTGTSPETALSADARPGVESRPAADVPTPAGAARVVRRHGGPTKAYRENAYVAAGPVILAMTLDAPTPDDFNRARAPFEALLGSTTLLWGGGATAAPITTVPTPQPVPEDKILVNGHLYPKTPRSMHFHVSLGDGLAGTFRIWDTEIRVRAPEGWRLVDRDTGYPGNLFVVEPEDPALKAQLQGIAVSAFDDSLQEVMRLDEDGDDQALFFGATPLPTGFPDLNARVRRCEKCPLASAAYTTTAYLPTRDGVVVADLLANTREADAEGRHALAELIASMAPAEP